MTLLTMMQMIKVMMRKSTENTVTPTSSSQDASQEELNKPGTYDSDSDDDSINKMPDVQEHTWKDSSDDETVDSIVDSRLINQNHQQQYWLF